MDAPYTTPSGYTPNNWYSGYWGLTTVRKAITQSMNVVTTKFFVEDVTPELAIDYCRKLGITTLTDSDYVESFALGGLTYGVTNLEMTGAYAAIANGGKYVRPVFYSKVVDRDGNVLLDNTNPQGEQVIKETTAYLLTSAMQDVVTQGTGTACALGDGMDVAGKTGTTSDSKDLWFVGYTPYLTAGIWLGYDQNYAMEGELSETEHEYLWSRIMRRIDAECGYEPTSFTVPENIGTRTVCSKSGKLVGTSACTPVTEYFDLTSLPSGYCNDHIGATICNVCGGIANENSKSTSYKEYSSSSEIPSYSCTCPPETESASSTESETTPTTTPSTEPPVDTPAAPTTPTDPTAPTPVG